jgi:hypothetical protein
MNKRRYVLTFISLILLPLMLFHFQNCAPATGASASSGNGGHVSLVDNANQSQIQFIFPNAEIQDEAPSADISGLCDSSHNGATLKWALWDEQTATQALANGATTCNGGQFGVTLEQLDQFVCGVSHLLVVQGDWGAMTQTQITRRCQPLASQPIPPPEGSPMGTTCDLEYSPASAAEQPCVQVCYRSNQVVYSQALDVSQCSSLAAGLASR